MSKVGIFITVFFALIELSSYSQESIRIDTVYSEEGKVEGFGAISNGNRCGNWTFYSERKGEITKWTYLNDSLIYSRSYTDYDRLYNMCYFKRIDSTYVKEGPDIGYKNGEIIRVVNYSNDKANGLTFIYYPTSQSVKQLINYVNDTLQHEAVFYYENGMVMEKGNYVDNAKNGQWTSYYENGTLKSEGSYTIVHTDSLNINDISSQFYDCWITLNTLEVKNGIWVYYSEDGSVIKTEVFENGKLIDE